MSETELFYSFQEKFNLPPLPKDADPNVLYPDFRHYQIPSVRQTDDFSNDDDDDNDINDDDSIIPTPSSSPTISVAFTSSPTTINSTQSKGPNVASPTPSAASKSSEPPVFSKAPSRDSGVSSPAPSISPSNQKKTSSPISSTTTPTSSPSKQDLMTYAPTVLDCYTNEIGNFGSTSSSATVIHFKYLLTTDQDLSSNITTEVLPFFEKSLLDTILSDLFTDICINRRQLKLVETNKRRRLVLIGASSQPADYISKEEKCGYGSQICSLVEGSMTLYEDEPTSSNIEFVNDLICNAMDIASYSHPAIISASCIDGYTGNTDDGVNGGTISTTGSVVKGQPVSKGIETYEYILASLAVSFFVFGMIFYRRRYKRNIPGETIDSSACLDDSDLKNNSIESGTPALDFTSVNG